jgi:hypothetical protein
MLHEVLVDHSKGGFEFVIDIMKKIEEENGKET